MKLSEKKYNIGSQILVILFFFGGMLLNYFLLIPIIDKEETARITADIDAYCLNFYPYDGFDITDKAQLDSALKESRNPYDGDFFILDKFGEIIYSKDGDQGDIFKIINEKHGQSATDLLRIEYQRPGQHSHIIYDKDLKYSFYACFEPQYNLMFFYAADYKVAGGAMTRSFSILTLFMALGGLIVIFICFLNIRRMESRRRLESLAMKELETAASIQKSMLPKGEKHYMQVDIDARLIPARKVGGDFFCYMLKGGNLYFCIGDVSGKGVPASLFMSKAVTLFRSTAVPGTTPAEIATRMNEELCINNEMNMFITAIIGSMRLFDGRTTFVNAGHEQPAIWDGKTDSKVSLLETSKNIPLGVIESLTYKQDEITMEKNSMMMLYTDGITEAKSKNAGMMGRKTLVDIIDGYKDRSSKEINHLLLNSVMSFEKGREQSDDITLLTFRNIPMAKNLVIKNDIKELRKIKEFTEEIFNECTLSSKDRVLVRSGLDEALTNCVRYAYDSNNQDIEIDANTENGKLIIKIKDSGKEFNPLEYQAEDSTELKIGGLGIPMIKANFDEVTYNRDKEYNILTLIKNL